MARKGKKLSEPKHHPSRDKGFYDTQNAQRSKWEEQYLDPKLLGPDHELEREQRRDAQLTHKPEDHQPPTK